MISKLQLFALVVVTAAAVALGGCATAPPKVMDTSTGEWIYGPTPPPSPSPNTTAE